MKDDNLTLTFRPPPLLFSIKKRNKGESLSHVMNEALTNESLCFTPFLVPPINQKLPKPHYDPGLYHTTDVQEGPTFACL